MKFPIYFNFLVFKTLGFLFLLSAFGVLVFVSVTHFNNIDETKPVLSTQGTVISEVYKFDGTSFVSVELEDNKVIPLSVPSNDYKINQKVEVFYTLETNTIGGGKLRGTGQTENISYSIETINPSQGKAFGFYGYSFLVMLSLTLISSIFFYVAQLFKTNVTTGFESTKWHWARLNARRDDDVWLSNSKNMNWNAVLAAFPFSFVILLPSLATNGYDATAILAMLFVCVPVVIFTLMINSYLEKVSYLIYARIKWSPLGEMEAKRVFRIDSASKRAYKYVVKATARTDLDKLALGVAARSFDGTVDELVKQLNSKQVTLVTV